MTPAAHKAAYYNILQMLLVLWLSFEYWTMAKQIAARPCRKQRNGYHSDDDDDDARDPGFLGSMTGQLSKRAVTDQAAATVELHCGERAQRSLRAVIAS